MAHFAKLENNIVTEFKTFIKQHKDEKSLLKNLEYLKTSNDKFESLNLL